MLKSSSAFENAGSERWRDPCCCHYLVLLRTRAAVPRSSHTYVEIHSVVDIMSFHQSTGLVNLVCSKFPDLAQYISDVVLIWLSARADKTNSLLKSEGAH